MTHQNGIAARRALPEAASKTILIVEDNDLNMKLFHDLLEMRGYGVLQVNYRGSGGRGNDFVVNAWKQWGGIIQNDITDGVKFAIDAKLADSSKICIYGASFGGYSAMMQPILNPGMYKCAIGLRSAAPSPSLTKNP